MFLPFGVDFTRSKDYRLGLRCLLPVLLDSLLEQMELASVGVGFEWAFAVPIGQEGLVAPSQWCVRTAGRGTGCDIIRGLSPWLRSSLGSVCVGVGESCACSALGSPSAPGSRPSRTEPVGWQGLLGGDAVTRGQSACPLRPAKADMAAMGEASWGGSERPGQGGVCRRGGTAVLPMASGHVPVCAAEHSGWCGPRPDPGW